MTKYRIVFVLPDLGGGGAQRVMLRLAGGLSPDRFERQIVSLGGDSHLASLCPEGVALEHWRLRHLRQGLFRLVQHVRTTKPDLVVSVMGYLNIALLAARHLLPRQTRIIVREANRVAATLANLPMPFRTPLAYRLLYRRADAIVAPSQEIATDLVAAAPKAQRLMHILPNPVDIAHLRKNAAQPIRRHGQGLRFVAAGRITRQKGFDLLLDLVDRLPSDAHIMVFGDGKDRLLLSALAKEKAVQHRVEFAGYTQDLPCWIAGADAFVMPSRWEGLPNAALEALALGTPVIASPESNLASAASLAPPGAVTIRSVGEEFAAAMRHVPCTADRQLRESMLPLIFDAPSVVAKFEELVLATLQHS